ncbi:MAG: hypothetical protein WBA57_26370 [Elainellaceae cyanobacterium]
MTTPNPTDVLALIDQAAAEGRTELNLVGARADRVAKRDRQAYSAQNADFGEGGKLRIEY